MIISFLNATLKQRDGRLNQDKPTRGFIRLLAIPASYSRNSFSNLVRTMAFLDKDYYNFS